MNSMDIGAISGIDDFNSRPAVESKADKDPERKSSASEAAETPAEEKRPRLNVKPEDIRELTPQEEEKLKELKRIDRSVKAHEMAHKVVAGEYAARPAAYVYERGPDGKLYAVGGEVRLDASRVPGDPEATIRKMQRIKRAALAPTDPSSQDLRAAVVAARIENTARQQMLDQQRRKAEDDESGHVFKSSVSVSEVFFGYSSAFPAGRFVDSLA
jgi:hypothetical protein